MTHITQQRPGKSSGCVDEGRELVEVVLHEHLRDTAVVCGPQTASDEHVTKHQQKTTEQEREQVT